jgi:FixJ family two-component response regulator
LRRILGKDADLIKTIQGRGYMFTGGLDAAPRPKAHIESDGSPAAVTAPQAEADSRPTEIAVIEDDDATREALDGLLRSSGLSPRCFASPNAFVDSAASRTARCLVLDVCLPGRSGLDFHTDMRRAGIHLPVIFISGHADVPMSVRAMKAGAVEFLTKPVRHEELLRAVNDAVARRSA